MNQCSGRQQTPRHRKIQIQTKSNIYPDFGQAQKWNGLKRGNGIGTFSKFYLKTFSFLYILPQWQIE